MWRRTLDCLGVVVQISSRVAELDRVLESVFHTYAEASGTPAVDYALDADDLTLARDGETIRRCREAIDLVAVLELDLYRQVMSRASGLLLHAGAVVGSGGAALVFAGRSGAGKSTLVRALLDLGYDYLSEECVALAVDGTCRGLARSLHVDDDSVAAPAGFSRGEYPIRRDQGGVQVAGLLHPPPDRIWRGAARTVALIAIDHAEGAVDSLVPMSGGDALVRLWPTVFRADGEAVAEAGQALAAVARFHLHTSSPEAAIERVLALAAQLGVEPR